MAAKVDWSVFLPEGEGKGEVVLSCSSCHDLREIITLKKTKAGWNRSMQAMISTYSAPVDEADLPIIVSYLSKHFGDNNPLEQLPMNVNSASAEALERLPRISTEAANAIVESRNISGPFASVEDLLRIKGLDVATLEKIRHYIKTQ
ncbi:MAG: helix-hairpin-helix domain-containing protein [Acidobacteria bacterium]|nr:helix-hairpin-helix domain-containing protein [Acidobacteriota bacterium]